MSTVSPCRDYGREYLPPLSVALSLLTSMALDKVLRDICALFETRITRRVLDLKLAAFVAAAERHEERVVERLGGRDCCTFNRSPRDFGILNAEDMIDQALRTF